MGSRALPPRGRARPSLSRSTGTGETPGPVTQPGPSRPGPLRRNPLTPGPLPSHNGSSRQGNSRPGAASRPWYEPSPGAHPWLRRPAEPDGGSRSQALLPPPVLRRRFHAGSADVPAPATGGAETRRSCPSLRWVENLRVSERPSAAGRGP